MDLINPFGFPIFIGLSAGSEDVAFKCFMVTSPFRFRR